MKLQSCIVTVSDLVLYPCYVGTPLSFSRVVAVQIFCGPTSTAALSEDEKLYVWGNNSGGMLGLGHQFASQQHVLAPQEVPALHSVRSVALGAMHGLALCAQ